MIQYKFNFEYFCSGVLLDKTSEWQPRHGARYPRVRNVTGAEYCIFASAIFVLILNVNTDLYNSKYVVCWINATLFGDVLLSQ